ncbi:MAG: hypothetical protein M3O20_08345 [Acidobacteriota bacterium]|nr:hypothetical protein [Acidobacteriota bacterium]
MNLSSQPTAVRRGWLALLFAVLSFVCCRAAASAQAVPPIPAVIVVGFVGGFVHQNDTIHKEVQMADHLRTENPAGMHVNIFANREGRQAYQSILQSLDSDENGILSDQEKNLARIVLYGHSWGASEAITLARALGQNGIPVLLTIQVDSVKKFGENDRLIPANVAQAVNFFQLNGFLHGRRLIQASDRLRTQILGNFQFDYKNQPVNCDGYPWYAQLFMKPHIEIESDPRVWNQVESLIRSKIVK